MKIFNIFLIFAQNINCGYMLEPQFYNIKVGCKGVFDTRTCFHDEFKSYVENIASWSNTPVSENTSLDNPSNCELKFKRRGIHIANLNIRHLKPKVDQMKFLSDQSNFGLCESFLNESVDNNRQS